MKKGSITIFCTLVMVLVASVLVVLLEAARIQEIRNITSLQTELAMESAFANYNTVLWKEYKILATNSTNLQEDVITYGENRVSPYSKGINLLQTDVEDAVITQLTLLTDGEGTVYIDSASNLMKERVGYGLAKELFNQYEVVKDVLQGSSFNKKWLEIGISQKLATGGSNPILAGFILQKLGLLDLIVPDTSGISQNRMENEQSVSHRVLQKGIVPQVNEIDWMDQILFQQYILTYMSHYLSEKPERALAYEVEYIIGKRPSDLENLSAVIEKLLLIREVCNFLYLTMDPTKYEEASALAIALAGISANPAVIEIVKTALLTAWAFGESVLDVRALLQGKKVPLLKSKESWTVSLSNIASIGDTTYSAKESNLGLSYTDYLGILLLLQQSQQSAYYTMDVQEATVRKQSQNTSFYLDQYLVQAEMEMTYSYNQIFYKGTLPWERKIQTKERYSYN